MLQSLFNALPPLYLAEHSLKACKILTTSEHVTAEEVVVLICFKLEEIGLDLRIW
jgi:hypothetical protein